MTRANAPANKLRVHQKAAIMSLTLHSEIITAKFSHLFYHLKRSILCDIIAKFSPNYRKIIALIPPLETVDFTWNYRKIIAKIIAKNIALISPLETVNFMWHYRKLIALISPLNTEYFMWNYRKIIANSSHSFHHKKLSILCDIIAELSQNSRTHFWNKVRTHFTIKTGKFYVKLSQNFCNFFALISPLETVDFMRHYYKIIAEISQNYRTHVPIRNCLFVWNFSTELSHECLI